MTDYFALLDEARRPWLDPEQLKEKYFARSRAAAPDAELNEAFRVLRDPKLRLQHLLKLARVDLSAGREVPRALAELFWNTGVLLSEVDRWLLRQAEAGSALSRALLSGERSKLEGKLAALEVHLSAAYEKELEQLRQMNEMKLPDEIEKLVLRYDAIAYLTRLCEQVNEKRFRLESSSAG